MKRVDAIAMGKAQKTTESIERKSKRIMRAVEQAIDYSRDKIDATDDKLNTLMDSLGEVSTADGTSGLQTRINRYAEVLSEQEAWEEQLNRLLNLKENLLADVDIKEEK